MRRLSSATSFPVLARACDPTCSGSTPSRSGAPDELVISVDRTVNPLRSHRGPDPRDRRRSDGVLRVSEAFADLGDRDRAREGLLVAADMLAASRDARDVHRLKELAERLEYQVSPDSPNDVQAPTATTATWTR